MTSGRRSSRGLALAVALIGVALCGCERGCLASWLGERGVGGAAPGGSGRAAPGGRAPGLDLSGSDCSDGLLRCVDGRVEASRVAHLPEPCTTQGSGEGQPACTCPWDALIRCPAGCVEEGLEAIGDPDAGALQLCRPELPIARPILPSDSVPAEICARDELTCLDGVVRSCERPGQPARPLGRCLHGCEAGIALDHGETKNPDGALAILCRRNHAERR